MSSKKSGKARRIGSTRKDLRGLGSQMRDKEADVFATLLEESRTMEHESATTGGEPKPIEEGSRPMGVELWTTGGEPKPIEEGSRPMGEESRTTGKEPKSMEEKSMAIGVASWSTERNSRTTGEKQEVDFKPEESSLSERTASLLAPSHDPYSAGTPHLESNKMEKKKRMGSSRRKLPTDLEEHRREGWDGAEQEEWQEGGKHAVGDQAGSKTAQPFGELHTEPRKASECLEGREESAMTGNQHAFHILDMPAIENKSVDSQFYPQSMYSEEAQKNKQLHTTNESNLIINLDQSEGRLTNEDTHDRDLLQSTDSGQLGYADAALQLPKSEENTLHEDNKHEMAHFEHKKRKMGSTRKGGRALQIKSDREQEFDILAEEMLRSSGDLADVCVLQGKESQEKSRLDVIQYINMEQVKMEGLLEMEENKEVEALTGTDRDKEQEKHKSTRETNEKHTISGLLGTDMVEDILVEMERREIDRPRSTGIAEENVKPEVRETDVVTEIRAPGLGGTGMVDRETEETTGTRILEFNETHRLRETHILEDNVTQENQGRDGGQRDEAEKESVTDVILGANVMKYEGASNEKESTKEEEGDGAQAKKTGKNWRQAQVMQIDLNMSFSSEKYEQEVTASERERNSPLENPSVVESFSFQDGTKTFIPEEQVKFTPFEDLLESRKNSQFYTSTHMEAPFTEDENEKFFIAPQEWENLGKKNKTESTHGNATKNKMENRIKGAGDDRSVLEGIRTEKIDMKLEREEKEQEDSWAITEDLNTILRDTGVLKELDIQEGDKSVAEEKQTPLVVEEVKGEPEVNMVGGIKENKWKLAEEGDIKMKGTDIAMEESVAVSQEFSKTETTHCNKDDSSYIYDPFHNVSVDPRVSERAATNTLSLEMNQKSDESSQKESTHLQKRKKMGSSRKGGRGLHKETEKSKGFRNIDGLEVSEQQEEREEERATEVKQNVINVVMEMTKEETKISMVEATSKSKEEIKIANDNSGAEDFESQQSVTEDPTAAEKLATNVVKGFEQHEDYSDRASSRNEKKRKIGTSHRRGRERLKEKEIQEMAETEVETMAMDNKESATDEVIKSVQNEEREYGNEKAERKSGSDSDKSHTSMVIPNLQRPENSAITTQQECSESQDTLLPAARRRKMGSRRQGQDNLRKRDVGLEWSEGCTAEAHVNTAALLQRMQEVFHQPDVEEKGCITWENVQGLSHELGLSIEELHQVFQQLDGDQDGLVTHQDLTKSLESCKQEQYFQFKREYSGTHSLGTSGLQGKADFGVRPSINEKLLTGSGLGQADPHLREGQALWEKKGTQARSEDTGSMSKTQEREEAWENEEETDVAGSKEQEREEAGEKEEETDEAGSKEQEREEAGEKEGETDEAGSKEQEREEAGEKEEETNEAGSKEQETEEPETWHKNNESQNAESKSDDYKAEKEELLSTSHEPEDTHLMNEEGELLNKDQERKDTQFLNQDQQNEWSKELDEEQVSDEAEGLRKCQGSKEAEIMNEDQDSGKPGLLHKDRDRERAELANKNQDNDHIKVLNENEESIMVELLIKNQGSKQEELLSKEEKGVEAGFLSEEHDNKEQGNQDTYCEEVEPLNEHGESVVKDSNQDRAIGMFDVVYKGEGHEKANDPEAEISLIKEGMTINISGEMTHEKEIVMSVKQLVDNASSIQEERKQNGVDAELINKDQQNRKAELLSMYQESGEVKMMCKDQGKEEREILSRYNETVASHIMNMTQNGNEAQMLSKDQPSEEAEILNKHQDHDEAVIINLVQEGEEAEILDKDQDNGEIEDQESEETERLQDGDNEEAEKLDQENKEGEITHKDQVRDETALPSIDIESEEAEILNDNQEYKEVEILKKHQEGDEFDSLNTDRDDEETEIEERYLQGEEAMIIQEDQEYVEVVILGMDQDNEKVQLDKELESEGAEILNEEQDTAEVYIQHEDQNSNDAENLGKYLEREEADITYKDEQREVTDLLSADTLGEETEMPKKDQDNEEAEIMHKVPTRDETNLLSLETESEFLTKCKASEEIELLSKDQEREGAGLLNMGQDNMDTERLSKDQQSEMTELLILNQVSKKPEITNEDQECVEVKLLIQDQESEEAEVMNMDHDNMEVYLQNKDWNSDEIQIQSNNKEGEEAEILSKHQKGEDMGVLNEEQDAEEIVIQDRDLETEEAVIINLGQDFYEAELLNRDQMSEKVEIINQNQEGEEAEILDQDQDSEELEIWDKGPESEETERLNQDEEHVEVQLLKKDQDNQEAEMLDQEKKEAEIHKDQVREETDLVSIDMETEVQFIDKENEDAEILNDNQECVEVDMLNKDQDNEKAETLDKKLESEEAEIPNQVQESLEVYIQHEDQNSNDAENLGKYLEREEADITYKGEQREVTDLLNADTLGEETEMPKKDQDNEEAEIMHKVPARDETNLLSLETESEFLTKCKASEEIELLSKDQEREGAGLLNTGQDNMDTERLSKDQQSEMTELLNLNQVSKKPEITNEDQECVEVELLIQDQESEEAEAVNTDHDNVEVYLQNKDWNSDEIQIQSNNKEGEEAEILSKHQEGEDMGVLNEEQDGEEIVIQDRDLETEEAVIINSGQDFYEAVLLNRDQMSEKVEIINQDQEGEDAEILDQDQDSEELEIWDKGPESEETERLNQDEEHVEVQLLKKDQDNQEAEMLDQEKKEAEIHKDQVREETDLVCIDKESEVQIIDKENEDAEIVNHNQECVEVDMLNKDQDNEKTETLDKKLESEEAEIPNQVQESVEVYIQHEYQNSNDAENLGKYLEREEADITYKDEQREVTDLLSADTLGEETEMPKKDQDNEEAEIMHKVSARDATNLLSLETESEFLTKCKASEEIELLSKDQEREEAGLLNTGQDNVEVYLLNKDWNSNELQIQSNHKEIEEAEILSCHQEGEDVEVLNKKQDEEEIIIPHRDLETEEAGQGQDFVQIELLNMGQMSEKVEIISQNQEGEEAEMLDQDQEYVGVELPCTLKYGYKTHLRDAFDDLREVGGSENECDPHTSRAVVEDNEWIWDCELLKEQQFYSGCNEKKESWDIWDETNEAELGSTVYRERSDLGSQIDNVIFWQRWREDEFGRNNETSQILANDLYPIPEENETENNIEYNNVEIAQDIAKIQEMPQAADQSNTIIHFIIDNHKLKEIQEEKCILSEGDVTESDEQRDIVRLMELREKTEDSNTFENNKEHQDIGTIEGTTGSTMENRQCSATLANAVNQKDSNELSECVTLDGEKQEANAIKQSHDSVLVRSDVLGGANKDSSRVPEIPNNDDETICTGRRMAIQTGSTVHEMGAMRGRQAMAETAEGVEVIQNAEFQMDGDRIQMQGSCEKDRDNVIEHLQLSMESDTKWDGGTSQGRDTIAMEMKRKEKTQRQNNYEGAGFKKLSEVTTQEEIEHRGGTAGQHKGEGKDWDTSERGLAQGDTALKLSEKESLHADRGLEDYNNDRPHEKWDETPVFNQNHGFEELEQKISTDEKKLLAYQGDGLEMKTECLHVGLAQGTIKTKETEVGQQKDKGSDLTECEQASIGFSEDSESLIEKLNCNMNVMEWSVAEQGEKDNGRRDEACKDNNQLPTELVEHGKRGSDMKRVDYTSRSSNKQGLSLMQHVNSEDKDKQGVKKREQGAERHRMTPEEVCGEEELRMEAIRIYEKVEQEMSGDVMAEREVAAKEQKNREDKGKVGFRAMGGEIVVTPEDNGQLAIGCLPTGSWSPPISGPDLLYNVVLVGSSSVGKTSFMKRIQSGDFTLDHCATIGLDSCIQSLLVDGRRVLLQLWDTAGQERYHSITKQILRKAQGLLLMYDITCIDSFNSVQYWMSCIQEGATDDVIIMLLGNKNDTFKREVPLHEGEKLAKEYRVKFMECSVATGENVTLSMETLARMLKQQTDQKEEAPLILRKEQPKQKSGCC